MSKSLLNNTVKYARFILRKEWIGIVIWLVLLLLITLGQAQAFVDLYPTQMERQAIAQSMENPAMIAMMGPAYGTDNYTLGALLSNQALLFTAIAVAIMSILFVNRNTRGDEEMGRIEVLRSLPIGRLSNMFATLNVIVVVNIVIALTIGFGLYGLGIESVDLNGSLLFGAILGATGIIFASITALIAQFSSNARGAMGLSFAVLGISYFIRAVGDISSEALSLLSPLGWILRSEVYVSNNWWPVILTVGIAIIILAASLYLNSIRDLGAGFFAAKPGRRTASALLKSPLGLGIKLLRVSNLIWFIAILILSASFGSLLGDIEDQLATSEMMLEILSLGLEYDLVGQFIAVLMALFAMLSTLPALISILKLRGEEKANRTENIVSRVISRTTLLGSFLIISIIVSFATQLLSAIGIWYVGSNVLAIPLSFGSILSSAMVYLPAIWSMIGLTLLLIGYLPRGTMLIWVYYGYSLFVILLGSILQLPDWLVRISLYENIPKLPVNEMEYTKIIAIIFMSIVFLVLGFIGYNKRDLGEA